MANNSTNSKTRKYQLTINNPIDNGFNHDTIRSILDKSNPVYYCLCDEKGSTHHTHVYVCYENAVYFSTMKKRFATAHIEVARGSSAENREYIRKEGKYKDSEKAETNFPETFEEFGEMPQDAKSKNESVSKQVLDMIEAGCSNVEIIQEHPFYATKITHINTCRQEILADKFSKTNRFLEVTYIFGDTGAGKTRYVMDNFGFENVYKVTNYEHPFDNYNAQDILLLDEFRSGIAMNDLLQILDIYPCRLPARYYDKTACYTKVFLISNEDLDRQYTNIQSEKHNTWLAFLRRINHVLRFSKNDIPFGDNKPIIEEIPISKYGACENV